jgi:PAS domain S-box-containing protein
LADPDRWTAHVAALRDRGFLVLEDRIGRRDGSSFPVEVGVKYVVHGKQDYLVAVIRDITERKRAEEDLARLAAAVESAADAIVITDPASGVIQYVNAAYEVVTGYGRGELLGRTLHFLESGSEDAAYFQGLRETLAREGSWNGRLTNRKKDGSLYFEECAISPVKNSQGKIINYVYVKRDVTEKLRLESIAESVSMMDNIGSVFAGVRHEIGNPINSINMILGILRAKGDDLSMENVRTYLGRMTEQIGRVEYVLRSLKSFNLYETQEPQDLRLPEFLKSFLPLVAVDLKKKGIALDTAIDDEATAFADPRALQQVLLNVFTNAADAVENARGPRITLTVERSDGLARIRVRDNGCGIEPEKLKRIFKPFFTTKVHGTGLGLVIVEKMLARMKGTVDLTSKPGEGTIVTIELPEGTA